MTYVLKRNGKFVLMLTRVLTAGWSMTLRCGPSRPIINTDVYQDPPEYLNLRTETLQEEVMKSMFNSYGYQLCHPARLCLPTILSSYEGDEPHRVEWVNGG